MTLKWKNKIIVFVVTLLASSTFSSVAMAQKVMRVMKDRGVVAINAGTDKDFNRGATVCIDGRGKRTIACGKIVRAQAKRSFVRITENIERIRRGMPARLDQATGPGGGSRGVAATSGRHMRNIKGFYLFSAMTPASFNKLTYNAPEATGEVNSLWKTTEAASNSLIGFGGEIEFPITASMSMALGGRYRFYRGAIIEANYDLSNGALFAEIEQAGSAMGFYLDTYLYDLKFSDSSMLRFSTGLDIDMSEVTLKAERKNDDDAADVVAMTDLKSSLGLASLRLGSHFVFLMGPIGLNTSLMVVMPLMGFGESFAVSGEDPNAARLGGGKDQTTDLQEQLAHQKSSLGLEITVGTSILF